MSNRRPQGGRRDFGRNDRGKGFGRSGVSPWQGGSPGTLPNLLPLAGASTEATLALASNIINLLQPRQNTVPSLLDMPIRRDFGPDLGRYDRGFGANRMGNQSTFRRTGNYIRPADRIRKPYKPSDGSRQQNKNTPKKDADPKSKPVKESSDKEKQNEGENQGDGEKKEAAKTRYDDVNPQLLQCHICNKSMWDGRSFENHLSGRAHAIMMQKTAESYALTADTMRQEFKIREMKRTRRSGEQTSRDFYCAMCDMYAADGGAHRKTAGHRKLKKYLHPPCMPCRKEMPTRIELDEHRLTAEHMLNMHNKQDLLKPKPDVMVISTLSMETSYLREFNQRWRRHGSDGQRGQEVKDEEKQEETGETKEINSEPTEDETDKDNENNEEGEQKKKPEFNDPEGVIVDYKEGDDLSHITKEMLPAYNTERGVGKSFLTEFHCVLCTLCHKLLDSEETAAVHLRTWRHYQLFNRMLQDKGGLSNQSKHQNQDGESSDMKRPNQSEESGLWKRRKTSVDQDDEDDLNETGDDKPIKDEACSVDETEGAADGDEDVDMPSADDLGDWEQSVDEILNDEQKEQNGETEEKKDDPQKPAEEEKVPEKPKEISPPPSAVVSDPKPKPSPTPRGRGRGRRRN